MKKNILIGAVIVTFFILAGCTAGQLGKAKEHWAKQDYEWIAKQDVTCEPSDDGCNQRHLIKGDACYRLAKSGKEAEKNYECAMSQLETGIAQTRDWKLNDLDLNRAQTYENLCESIRNLQDMKKGAEADALTGRLVYTSQAFLSVEPGNLAGVYFLNSARFSMLTKCRNHPEKCPELCDNLKAVDNEIMQVMPKAEVSKYMDNFHRLHMDITGTKRSIAGCQ
jgi:hypothetical protein